MIFIDFSLYVQAEGRPFRFWLDRKEWTKQLAAFVSVAQIHIHSLEYVFWPPYSSKEAQKILKSWTRNLPEGRLTTVSVSVASGDGGDCIAEAFPDLTVARAKREGYLLKSAEDFDDFDESDLLFYDWTLKDGTWEVEIPGSAAECAAHEYASFGYEAGQHLDDMIDQDIYSDDSD